MTTEFAAVQFFFRSAAQGEPVTFLLAVDGKEIEVSLSVTEALMAAHALTMAIRGSLGHTEIVVHEKDLERPECRVALAMSLLQSVRHSLFASVPSLKN